MATDRFVRRSLFPFFASFAAGMVVSFGLVLLRNWGELETLELIGYDWLLRLRAEAPSATSRIVLVTITESDVRSQGWPLTDATLAHALKNLTQLEPRVIGLDIYRDLPVPPGGRELNQVLQEDPRIIVTMKMAEGSSMAIPAPAVLKNTAQVGFNDVLVDRDGIVRRGLLFLDDGENTAYSFPLRLALLYLKKEGITPQPDPIDREFLRIRSTTLPPFKGNDGGYVGADDRGYQFLIDFRDARREFPTIDFATLLGGRVKAEAIKDKIVLIGVKAESVPDIFHTPLSSGSIVGDRMAGVELHGNIANQLLRVALDSVSPTAVMSDIMEELWIYGWGLLGAAFGLWAISPWHFSLMIGGGLLLIGFFAHSAFLFGWWIPLVPPAIAWFTSATVVTAYRSWHEGKQRSALMQLFERYVSAEVANTIWQHRDEFVEGRRPRPQKLTATVLFTDLVNFTSISEQQDPQNLMAWLNEYMEEMAQQVIQHGGVINKYIGDSIMAIFGVPIPRQNDAEIIDDAIHAVDCALNMADKLVQLNSRWHAAGRPVVGMRIGIFTGPMVVGSIGSSQRLEYTVIGDIVNTASRLEGFAKDLFNPDILDNPCRVLIGESTYHCVTNHFRTEKLGELGLKGKSVGVMVYRVLGRNDEVFRARIKGAKDDRPEIVFDGSRDAVPFGRRSRQRGRSKK
ncbi:MAG: CHASE2 domain-containing protein [Alphaproteobacteria bacterium]